MCVHVKNPFLAVLRVVSLNVHAKTAPAGSNPFEDEDDEDDEEEELEVVAKQQTTVNHIIANKEDIKTLVNRSRRCSPTSFLPFFPSFFGLKDLRSPSLVFIALLPSSLKPSHLSPAVECCVDLHGQWHHTQPVCICSSLLTLARLAKHYRVYMRLNQTRLLHSDLNID